VKKVVADKRNANDFFGYRVAISGNYAFVGSQNKSGIHIFKRAGNGSWNFTQEIMSSDFSGGDLFGRSVSRSGAYVIVGDPLEDEDPLGGNTLTDAGSAYLFELDGNNNWTEVQKIVASDRNASDQFGYRVAISGSYAIVGAEYEDEDSVGANTLNSAGSAYIFERDSSGKWLEVKKIVASDRAAEDNFGGSLSISGNYVVVGAEMDDEDFAGANTMSAAGSAYIFERDGNGNWSEVQKITHFDRAIGDRFGSYVSISGNTAIVSAPWGVGLFTGKAYIYNRSSSGNWTLKRKIVSSDLSTGDQFGRPVAISGNQCIVGAPYHDIVNSGVDTIINVGAVYIFKFDKFSSLNGQLYDDVNPNCTKDVGEGGLPFFVKANQHFTMANDTGFYQVQILDSINYTIEPIIPKIYTSMVQSFCPQFYSVYLDTTSAKDTSGFDFGFNYTPCPILRIDVNSNRRRRCMRNRTIIKYCNAGFADEDSVQVTVQLPEFVHLLSTDNNYYLSNDGNYIFDIDTLGQGQCGQIIIIDSVACINGIAGLTQCTKAWITPVNQCIRDLDTISANIWDNSSLAVEGRCLADSIIRFVINNLGQLGGEDMQDSSEYRIYVDNQLSVTSNFLLYGGGR